MALLAEQIDRRVSPGPWNTWYSVKVRVLIREGFDLFVAAGIHGFVILASCGPDLMSVQILVSQLTNQRFTWI